MTCNELKQRALRFFVERSITEVGPANIGYQLNVSAVEQMATNLVFARVIKNRGMAKKGRLF